MRSVENFVALEGPRIPMVLPLRSFHPEMPASLRASTPKTAALLVCGCSFQMETRSSPWATAFSSESGTPPATSAPPPTTSAVAAPPPVARCRSSSMPNSLSQPCACARLNHMFPALGGVGRATRTLVTLAGAAVAAGAGALSSSPPQAATTIARTATIATQRARTLFLLPSI